MNSQFAPTQSFGIPPQSYPQNRASSAQNLQEFQNVPLGPPQPGEIQNGPPPPTNYPPMKPLPSNDTREQYMPPTLAQIPPVSSNTQSNLPPSQFPPHISKPGAANDMKSANILNGPPLPSTQQQFQNGPISTLIQNGPGQLPPNMGFNSMTPQQSNLPRPPLQNPQFQQQNSGSYPPTSQRGGLPGQNFSSNPPTVGQPPLVSPLSAISENTPVLSSGPPSGQQPSIPRQLNHGPPVSSSSAASNRIGQYPGQFNQSQLPNQMGGNLPSMNQSPMPGQPPVSGSKSLSNQIGGLSPMNQPPMPGQPPLSGSASLPNQPLLSNQMGGGVPPMSQPSKLGQSPLSGSTSLPNQSLLSNQLGGGLPPMSQPPMPGQPPLSGSTSIPNQSLLSNQMGGGLPLMGQPSMSVQPSLSGSTSLPNQPTLSNQMGGGLPPMRQPPMPGQPPLPGSTSLPNHSLLSNQMGGGLPPMRQPTQSPLSNQMVGNLPQMGQLPKQALPPTSTALPPTLNRPPPLPGQLPQNQYQNLNQLNSQMQGMNLSGSTQYPGPGMMKNVMNGENGPHMPPPLSQQQYMNNHQMRGHPSGPGYPPMPGQQPIGGPAGPYPQSPYQQPQQNKKLDPDQMPSPIQVIEDDKRNRSGVFCTNQKGLVPPLVTTNFVVTDQGNSSPRFIRSTMYSVPISQDIMKQTAIPFSLSISPMARTVENEYPPPVVNFGDLGPVRCIRCKAYMCPFMQFIDSGRRFQCLFCKATTDVPAEYFQHLDHTGQRMDRFERPELVLGTYEFVATTDYCRNNTLPKPPGIIFIIDVSYNSIKSGLVHLLCSQMKSIIENLPSDGQEKSNMKVGFITYNSTVHFYNIKGTLAAPQMLVVGDIHEMFMPLLDGFLATPEESGPLIEQLMQQIPTMFADTRETETILLPAILAGLEALKASECAGKLLVFHSTLPIAEAPGKLKNRDDRKLLSTDKERTVLTPQIQSYNQLGQDCVGAGCSVDLFVFNNAYIDIATISQVSRLTGGEVFKYTYFQADIDGERLINDIITDISRPTAFDAIMRVRTSTGVRPTDFYGHFFMSNTTDVELAAIDCDKAVAVEIKHDDKLSEEDGVYIQTALLYTSCSGQRRLRIINLSLKTSSQMADLYRSCDSDTVINYIAKQSAYKLLENNPKAVKDNIVTRTAQILATYRKNCASPSSAGQLILPECMKLLPLYVNCLLKSDALSGGSEMTIDDRSYVMQAVMTMDITTSVYHFYPRLIPLHDLDTSKEPEVPSPIRCTIDKMNEQGVYILENGIHMFLWIGLGANSEFIQKLFDVPSAIQVDIERADLPKLDNPVSNAVRSIIDEVRYQRHRYMRLNLVRQREKMEHVFKHFLVEDRGTDGSPSYVDFLIHMHKEIRTLLS